MQGNRRVVKVTRKLLFFADLFLVQQKASAGQVTPHQSFLRGRVACKSLQIFPANQSQFKEIVDCARLTDTNCMYSLRVLIGSFDCQGLL